VSALLEIVQELAEVRRNAETELRRAIVRAKSQHTLEAIGRAAMLSKQRVSQIVNAAKEEDDT
jgi:DNA-directed RNA polymerase sigma subunit (sigma70/sigma32)